MIKTRNKHGFTLIELMIVIAIIGVLAAIAVPNFQKARRKANQRACYANMKTISGALEMYNLDNNQDGRLPNFATGSQDVSYEALIEGGYLQSMPMHPGNNKNPSEVYSNDANGIIFCGQSGAGDIMQNQHGSIQLGEEH
jgi:type II secretion system protein G